jgi:enoyl reductase-like protein
MEFITVTPYVNGFGKPGELNYANCQLTDKGQVAINNPNNLIKESNMSKKEFNMTFNAPVTGVAGNVEGNQNIYAPEQKPTLAEAAAEIQKLLKQLEESNPTATVEKQQAFVDIAVSPTLKAKFVSALQAGWKETIKEFLDNPYVNVGVAILEGWLETE